MSRKNPSTFSSKPWIALVGIPLSGIHAEVLRGIQQRAHAKGWTLFYLDKVERLPEVEANVTFFKGCIALIADGDIAERLGKLPFPVVNISNTFPQRYGFPAVLPDDRQIGRLAAEWFLSRGFSHFCLHFPPGIHEYRYLEERSRGFLERIRERGFETMLIGDFINPSEYDLFQKSGLKICRLKDLPRPCALFSSSDTQASYICFVAKAFGCQVPEDLAVMGVDNVELFCEMSIPPLTSIDPNARELGTQSVNMLERQMAQPWNGRWPYEEHLIQPGGVVVRDSANEQALDDPYLARARQIILNQATEGINVGDVAQASGLSRRALERRYQKVFGESILPALNRVRAENAIHLLQNSSLPLYEIAERSGFRDTHQMNRVFERLSLRKPIEWRSG